MKKLTIQFLTIAIAVLVFSVTDTLAQRIKLKDGQARINTTVKANGKKTFTISGRDFRSLRIRQTKGGKFRYEIRRGSQLLSSGHQTGFSVNVNSDRRSTYRLTIVNNENKARRIGLSIVTAGGGNDI